MKIPSFPSTAKTSPIQQSKKKSLTALKATLNKTAAARTPAAIKAKRNSPTFSTTNQTKTKRKVEIKSL